MADKTIGELTKATSLDDSSLMIAEQQGEAVAVPGSLFKQFARDGVSSFVASAEQAAENAAVAKVAAETAAQAASASADMAAASELKAKKSESVVAANTAEAKAAQVAAEKARDEARTIAGGDFLEISIYDPQGKKTDIFAYVDKQIGDIGTILDSINGEGI